MVPEHAEQGSCLPGVLDSPVAGWEWSGGEVLHLVIVFCCEHEAWVAVLVDMDDDGAESFHEGEHGAHSDPVGVPC